MIRLQMALLKLKSSDEQLCYSCFLELEDSRLIINGISYYSSKTIDCKDLHKVDLFSQLFDPLMILLIEKHCVEWGDKALSSLHKHMKYRHILHLLFPRNWLAVQSILDAQHQNFSSHHVRSKISVIIAGEADDVEYHTENRIGIDEECVHFTGGSSDEYIRLSDRYSRSLALLMRLDSDELQLQDEHYFSSCLIVLDEQIQVAIDDFEKGSWSEFSECCNQQNCCKLNSLSFVREGIDIHHSVTAQKLHKIYCIQ